MAKVINLYNEEIVAVLDLLKQEDAIGAEAIRRIIAEKPIKTSILLRIYGNYEGEKINTSFHLLNLEQSSYANLFIDVNAAIKDHVLSIDYRSERTYYNKVSDYPIEGCSVATQSAYVELRRLHLVRMSVLDKTETEIVKHLNAFVHLSQILAHQGEVE